MDLHHPDVSQKIGTVLGGFFGLVTQTMADVVINTAVGATVGFVVTTLCRFIWSEIKKKYNEGKINKLNEEDDSRSLFEDH